MPEVFVIRNQLGHYWGKAKTWVDGSQPRAVLRTRHQDEAINTLFELSSKDIELRGEVVATTLTERDEPDIEPSTIPLPQEPEEEREESTGTEAETAAPESTSTTHENETDPATNT